MPGPFSALAAFLVANKAVATVAATALVATGGTVAVAIVVGVDEPEVVVDALDLPVEALPAPEPLAAADPVELAEAEPDEDPRPEPAVVDESTPEPSVEDAAKPEPAEVDPAKDDSPADEPEAGSATEPKPEPKPEPATPKPEPATSGADVRVSASGDADRIVVRVDNLGSSTSGNVKVKAELREGAGGTLVVRDAPSGADCDGWYCYVGGVPIGEAVATVVFAVEDLSCADPDGGVKIRTLVDGSDDGHVWLNLCEGVEVAGGGELSVSVTGPSDDVRIAVTNAGDSAATNVWLGALLGDGEGTITFVGGTTGVCDAQGCWVQQLGAGEELVLRVAYDVDCETHPQARAKGYATSVSAEDVWTYTDLCS